MSNPTAVPAHKLRALRYGATITVLYRAQPGAEIMILTDSFPKEIAVLFSGLCQSKFPPVNKIALSDLTKPRPKTVTVEGGDLASHKEVLEWMLSCCEGFGIKPFKHAEPLPFWRYVQALESAQKFEIDVLQKQLLVRLDAIARKQVHSEDVRVVYRMLSPGHDIRRMVADSIGAAIWDRRLLGFGHYKKLRQECHQFDADVTCFINKMKANLKAERMKQGEAGLKNQQGSRQMRRGRAGQGHARYRLWNENAATQAAPVHDDRVKVHEDGSTTMSCAVARKAAKGRPTYVKADLDLLGVTSNSFSQGPNTRPRRDLVAAKKQLPSNDTTGRVRRTSTAAAALVSSHDSSTRCIPAAANNANPAQMLTPVVVRGEKEAAVEGAKAGGPEVDAVVETVGGKPKAPGSKPVPDRAIPGGNKGVDSVDGSGKVPKKGAGAS